MLTISPHITTFPDPLATATPTGTFLSHDPFMQPSQLQPKRKTAPEAEENPLLNAVKKTKKGMKNASNKSKLLANAEATGSGLFIVRESPLPNAGSSNREGPSFSQPSSNLPLKRNATSDLRPPPAKKARAESQPAAAVASSANLGAGPTAEQSTLTAHSRSGSLPPTNGSLTTQQRVALRSGIASIPEEDDIEDTVRAMDAESDHLRRNSRILVADSSTSAPRISFSSEKDKLTSKSKGRSKSNAVDTIQPLPSDESLQIERNKRLREGAMNAIAAANGDVTHAETSRRGREREREQTLVNGHHRRKSSLGGRGKRISTSFEVTGVIPQPHNSVSDASFYKHIDADLPDSERLRTLFIWCASRAAGKNGTSSKPNSTSKDNPSNKDNPPPNLPPLSLREQQVLKTVRDNVIRMLAERKVDLGVYGNDQAESSQDGMKDLQPNEQNVTNRMLEVRYAEQIKRVQEEEEAWKRVNYHYDSYIKRQKELLEKRKARLALYGSLPPNGHGSEEAGLTTPSEKAKGKQRDTGLDDPWRDIHEHLLPEDLQRGARLARALLASDQIKSQSQESPSSHQKRPKRGSDTPLPLHTVTEVDLDLIGQSLDQELQSEIRDVQFQLDWLLSRATTIRTMVNVTEELNNRWFTLLNQNLASRVNIRPGSASSSTSRASEVPSASSSTTDPSSVGSILRKYAQRPPNPGPPGFIIDGHSEDSRNGRRQIPASSGVEPQDLLRALSIVDQTRPPSQVGDAARRAAREVQRVGESGGIGVVGGKRITGIVAGTNVLNTPRKAPTTPRRNGDRTPRRDRTPGRDR